MFQDLFDNLTLSLPALSVKASLDEETRQKYRGHRQMSKIVVETFSDFDSIMNQNSSASNVDNDNNCGDKSSKESSPVGSSSSSTSRESSKRSTKDSTPVAGMETDSAQNQVTTECQI